MRNLRSLLSGVMLLALLLLVPARITAQEPQSRALATSLGVLAGAAGGGYLSVSVVVLEARFGQYIHDVDDILGWRSAPFLIGATAGGALGFYSPERLQGAVVYGAAGLGLGGLLGLALGDQIWEPPEGRWAGAAIGAGLGLLVGNAIGVMNPLNLFTNPDDGTPVETTGVPIVFRIAL